MAEILSSSGTEPGFYSQVRENANLQLPPNTLNIVAIVGTGTDTDTQVDNLAPILNVDVRAYDFDILSKGVKEFVGWNSTLAGYPSDFGFGAIGSIAQGVSGYALAGTTLSVSVRGQELNFAMTGATATAAEAADIINIAMGPTGDLMAEVAQTVTAGVTSSFLLVASRNAEPIQILSGSANSVLGFVANAYGNVIYWHVNAPVNTYQAEYLTPRANLSPRYFYSASSVEAAFGAAGADNTVSLAAKAVFAEAGNSAVVLCRVMDPVEVAKGATYTMAEYDRALTDLEKYNCNIVVPMLPINVYDQVSVKTMNHVSIMSNKINRRERICVLGVDETETILPLMGNYGATGSWQGIMSTFASVTPSTGWKTNRVVVMAPGSAYVDSSTKYDGTYLAACMAGRLVNRSYDEATPMTRKPFVSVAGLYANLNDEKSRTEKNTLSGTYGCTVVEMNGSAAIIRRSVTANTTSIASQELSIVRSFDRVATELRALLEAQFIGTKIEPSTSSFIASSTNRYLSGMVSAAIIGAYRGVSVTQNQNDPRQFDVSFEAVPIYPFLWGMLDISITLQ